MSLKFNRHCDDEDGENDEEKDTYQAIRDIKGEKLLQSLDNMHASSCVINRQPNRKLFQYYQGKSASNETAIDKKSIEI